MDQIIKFKCPKCGTSQYETGEIWTVGTVITRIFGIHNKRFTFVSCTICHFTEFYNAPPGKIGEILRFNTR
jgi:predicted nucleic-acid-binding Zn-ribbon protein